MFPNVDDLVVIQIKKITDTGIYVELLEYNNIEGFITLSELTRVRFRSITALVRKDKRDVAVVLRVDQEKGYVDLSKRRVTPDDQQRANHKYAQSQAVHGILGYVAESSKTSLEQLYRDFGWDLYERFPHALDAFKSMVKNHGLIPASLSPFVRSSFLSVIKQRLTPKSVKLRVDMEVTCFAPAGIDGIKAALKAGERKSVEDFPLKVCVRLFVASVCCVCLFVAFCLLYCCMCSVVCFLLRSA